MSGPDHPFLDELNAYLDGVLEPERVRALEERLSRDAELREELDELRRTVDLLHALAEEPAPAELRARILGALPRGRRFVLPSYVTAAAGLAAAVLVAILVWPEGGTAPVNEVALVEPVELDEAEERSVKTARDENLHTFSRLVETEASSTAKLGAVVKDARELDSVTGDPKLAENPRAAPASPEAKKRGRMEYEPDPADGFREEIAGRRFQKSADRAAYLRQLAGETPERVRAHIDGLSAQLIPGSAAGLAAPSPQTYSFGSPEEAGEVRRILNRVYGAKNGRALGVDLEQEDDRGEVTDEVEKGSAPSRQPSGGEKSVREKEGAAVPETERLKRQSGRYEVVLDLTPRQQAQVERWLLLLSVPPRNVFARPGVSGEWRRSAGKRNPRKVAEPAKEEAEAESAGDRADAKQQKAKGAKKAATREVPATRTVRFGLLFPVAPSPAPSPARADR